jgi:hypothetical protein
VKGSYQSHIIVLQLVTGCEENDNVKESITQDEVQQLTNGDENLVKCAGDYHIYKTAFSNWDATKKH